jgi:hypothetical protein
MGRFFAGVQVPKWRTTYDVDFATFPTVWSAVDGAVAIGDRNWLKVGSIYQAAGNYFGNETGVGLRMHSANSGSFNNTGIASPELYLSLYDLLPTLTLQTPLRVQYHCPESGLNGARIDGVRCGFAQFDNAVPRRQQVAVQMTIDNAIATLTTAGGSDALANSNYVLNASNLAYWKTKRCARITMPQGLGAGNAMFEFANAPADNSWPLDSDWVIAGSMIGWAGVAISSAYNTYNTLSTLPKQYVYVGSGTNPFTSAVHGPYIRKLKLEYYGT